MCRPVSGFRQPVTLYVSLAAARKLDGGRIVDEIECSRTAAVAPSPPRERAGVRGNGILELNWAIQIGGRPFRLVCRIHRFPIDGHPLPEMRGAAFTASFIARTDRGSSFDRLFQSHPSAQWNLNTNGGKSGNSVLVTPPRVKTIFWGCWLLAFVLSVFTMPRRDRIARHRCR